MPDAPRWSVVDDGTTEIVRVVKAYAGICNSCGFTAFKHTSHNAAQEEVQRHHQEAHADEWPKHNDGTPCFHATSDCTEHGSCMDCGMCKLLCECN